MSGPPVNERIAQRRAEVRAERRSRRLRRTASVAALVLLLVVGALLERTSLVALDSVAVSGTERLEPSTVRELSGLEPGTSVLRLRLDAADEAVEAHPLVADAVVERDGVLGVRVVVREHVPVLVARGDGASVLVAGDGSVVAPDAEDGLPVVQLAEQPPAPGGDVEDLPALAAAHRVATGLPGPLAALVTGLGADGPEQVELELVDGTLVRWGDAERGDEKARALGAVLEDLDGAAVAVIDVRAPSAPTVTP